MAAGAQARRAPLSVADLLAGRWTVRRELEDRRRGVRGAFEGVADLAPDGAGGLRWHEHGHVRLGAHAGPAERTLHVVCGEAGWEVRFPDGRLFHRLDLAAGGACDAVHPCGEDVYTGRYAFAGPDELHVRWDVTGPEADEALRAVYRRVAPSDAAP